MKKHALGFDTGFSACKKDTLIGVTHIIIETTNTRIAKEPESVPIVVDESVVTVFWRASSQLAGRIG